MSIPVALETVSPESGGPVLGRTQWQQIGRAFRANRPAVASVIVIIVLVLVAVCAPLISAAAGHGPNQLFPGKLSAELGLPTGPSRQFLFGIDADGRDVFVRCVYGLRTSLIVVRGQTLALRHLDFVSAARGFGAPHLKVMFAEILPNLTAQVIVYMTLIIPSNILFEASLSFLGVGIPQTTPSLGRMIADATNGNLFTYAWWMMAFPGILLLLITFSFNVLGDGLRDAITGGS